MPPLSLQGGRRPVGVARGGVKAAEALCWRAPVRAGGRADRDLGLGELAIRGAGVPGGVQFLPHTRSSFFSSPLLLRASSFLLELLRFLFPDPLTATPFVLNFPLKHFEKK